MINIEQYIKQHELLTRGLKIHSFSESTHTAEEAASLLQCKLSQIVKTIIIIVETKEEDIPMLVIVPGTKKLRQRAIRKLLKEELQLDAFDSRLATKDEVIKLTGYPVGAVPPISLNMTSLMDSDVQTEQVVYGGGGSTNSIVEIPTSILIELTNPIAGNICTPL